MQRIGGLWPAFLTYENFYSAFKKARSGTNTEEAAEWSFNREYNINALLNEIAGKTYAPGDYRYFRINDPKDRTISVAPFRDRVVHHALVNVIGPIYERRFIYDSYATRKNKGTHRAVKRAQHYLRRKRWYLKTDISHYFYSINHDILLSLLDKKIKDKEILSLCERVIRKGGTAGVGIPIGNLTSQFFANVYLDRFDHWIKDEKRVQCYIRYMDDIVFFDNSKEALKELLFQCKAFLTLRLGLRLKEKATYINSRSNGLSFLGTRIYPNMIRLKPENAKRSLKRLDQRRRALLQGTISEETYQQSLQSVMGLWKHYNTYRLRRKVMGHVP